MDLWPVSVHIIITYIFENRSRYRKEPSINDDTHLGGGWSAKRWHYSISLFSKMGDIGEEGVKNLKKWVISWKIPYWTISTFLVHCVSTMGTRHCTCPLGIQMESFSLQMIMKQLYVISKRIVVKRQWWGRMPLTFLFSFSSIF